MIQTALCVYDNIFSCAELSGRRERVEEGGVAFCVRPGGRGGPRVGKHLRMSISFFSLSFSLIPTIFLSFFSVPVSVCLLSSAWVLVIFDLRAPGLAVALAQTTNRSAGRRLGPGVLIQPRICFFFFSVALLLPIVPRLCIYNQKRLIHHQSEDDELLFFTQRKDSQQTFPF